MSVLVTRFSYNRPHLLRLCSEYTLKGFPEDWEYIIFDDSSTDEKVRIYLEGLMVHGRRTIRVESDISRSNYHQRASRLAVMRAKAIDLFLEDPRHDYIIFLDDDVLVTSQALGEAVNDFSSLMSTTWAKVGALTLHGICTHGAYYKVQDKVFSELRITGEANVIFSRSALLGVGNHLGPQEKGFADTQFDALRKADLKYYDRVFPLYDVQHLGIGPGSSAVHRDERTPIWNIQLYRSTYRRGSKDELLTVANFPVKEFENMASRIGAEKAAAHFTLV